MIEARLGGNKDLQNRYYILTGPFALPCGHVVAKGT